MNKTRTYKTGFISLLACVAVGMQFSLVSAHGEMPLTGSYYAPRADGVPERIILTFSGDPATTAAVTWRTAASVTSPEAQIAVAGNSKTALDTHAVSATATSEVLSIGGVQIKHHTVTFGDLQPGTRYCYRVGGGGRWSEWFQFRTAQAGPEPFRFIYMGDTQNDLKSHVSRVVRKAFTEARDPGFMLHAGDLVANSLNDDEWGDWFYSLGWISGSIPHLAVPGNHEYNRDASGTQHLTPLWRPHFAFPENGLSGLEETSYYMDYQGVRFVFLNTMERPAEQAAWLGNLLSENTNPWTIVTVHHPMYNTGAAGAGPRDTDRFRKIFVPVFDQHKVDLVLQGHDHTYARTHKLVGGEVVDWAVSGTVYATSVAGGKMYGYNDTHLHRMAKYELNTQTYQLLSIDGSRLVYEAWTASGELLDSFELTK